MTSSQPDKFASVPDLDELVLKFINTTSSHIFLTGKAGTGKTTFLKNLFGRTHKRFLIVAPTGIAALNAGGVTIHSQFLLPHGTFLPERKLPPEYIHQGNFLGNDTLARKHPLNSARKQILRSIDLLVIDEVSMLRADLLDAIDYRLKAARGNFYESFGGVQMLFIGDLYQLPPVVKRIEEQILKKYYASAWFYNARALQNDPLTYIELDKIYRQHDATFIRILNNLRNNSATQSDITELNKHFLAHDEIKNLGEIITLTTHNYKADELNLQELKALEKKSYFFDATINGDFPESMYPVLQRMELKEGAQIMFIKNDAEDKSYFNGKLAKITSISNEGITVKMESGGDYQLKKQTWENKKYTLNSDTKELEEEVVGTFEHYPIKLAWAITVHKSQGLTFDKAIIDVDQAFTDGQVYVALSRIRSLDGLVLRSRINPEVVSTNKNIVEFHTQNNVPNALPTKLREQQQVYVKQLFDKTFDFEGIIKEIRYIQKGHSEIPGFSEKSMKPTLLQIMDVLELQKSNTRSFNNQLEKILLENNVEFLLERLQKGTDYYKSFLLENLNLLLRHLAEMRQRKRVKTYVNHLVELDQLISKKLEEIDKVTLLTQSIIQGKVQVDFDALTKARAYKRTAMLEKIEKEVGTISRAPAKRSGKKERKKKDNRSTYDITLELLRSGLTVSQIANERGLVQSTIEGHLAKAVATGIISIFDFMKEEDVTQITNAIRESNRPFSSNELFNRLKRAYSYGQLRAVMAHLNGEN